MYPTALNTPRHVLVKDQKLLADAKCKESLSKNMKPPLKSCQDFMIQTGNQNGIVSVENPLLNTSLNNNVNANIHPVLPANGNKVQTVNGFNPLLNPLAVI
jgi:hypothetical protein